VVEIRSASVKARSGPRAKPAVAKGNSEDHRIRVGAQRREKTRLRLLESALAVFADKGPDLAVIEDFIAAAGVSRGTFYNHFRTTSELLLALAGAMSDEVLQVVDPAVLQLDDPVQRFATGTRLYMQMALRYPMWGRFITRVGTRIATRGQLIDEYLSRDLALAIKRKRIRVDKLLVARDIMLGSIFYGIETMLTEPTHLRHPEQMLHSVMLGFGVAPDEAYAIAFMPLPTLGPVAGPIFSKLESVPSRRVGKPAAQRRKPLARVS
jgi:AcrR family transcriptional regulator